MPELRLELDYCAPRALPLSIFRGRPWPGPGEPMWLDRDREWALAWELDRTLLRLPCGCYPDETVGEEHADRFLVEPVVCEKHRMIGEAQARWQKEATEADPKHGIHWAAVREPD